MQIHRQCLIYWIGHRSRWLIRAKSDHNSISCGFPKSSVLGPLSFSLYINDLYVAIVSESMRLFVNEIVFFMHAINLNNLINDITEKFIELYNWCVCNKLTMNGEKTNFVLFQAINKPIPHNFDQIKRGLWKLHVLKLLMPGRILWWDSKMEWACWFFFYIIHSLNILESSIILITRQSSQLWDSYIMHLSIQNKVWYWSLWQYTCKNIFRIQVKQNKLLKLILSWDWPTPTNFIHSDLKILKVEDIHWYHISLLINVLWKEYKKISKLVSKLKLYHLQLEIKGPLV